MPHAPDHPPALHAARKAVADLRPDSGTLPILALILTLLLRLLARLDTAWTFPDDEDPEYPEYHDEYGFDAYAFLGVDRHALVPRPMGRAPHAACIEAGLVPDWILPGIRNRGMRPRTHPTEKKLSPLGGEGWVRGPRAPPFPPCGSPTLKNPPTRGRRLMSIIISISN